MNFESFITTYADVIEVLFGLVIALSGVRFLVSAFKEIGKGWNSF